MANIESAEVPWSDSLVLVCTKCARKLGDGEITENLKKELKERFNERLGKGTVRVVTSSCLDVCPKDRIALGVARNSGNTVFETFTVERGTDPDEIIAWIQGLT